MSAAIPPVTAPLQPPWLCCLLCALRGMMDDQPGPQHFFLMDGLQSGLRLPHMPRWPAHKGYTFCAWVRLEREASTPRASNAGHGDDDVTAVAFSPCLFSFCGEKGQGVAACFVPMRRKGPKRPGSGVAAASGDTAANAAGSTSHSTPVATSGLATSTPRSTPQQYALEIRVGKGKRRPPAVVRFPGARVTAGEWVFVAVAHAPSTWGQRGEAAVLVGDCWRTATSPFPRFGEGGVASASVACHLPPQVSCVGEHAPEVDGLGAKIAGRPMLGSIRGQVT